MLFSFQLFAIDENCLSQLEQLIETPAEKFLFETQKHVFEPFQINCEKDQFELNNLLTSGAFVFAHEGAHFADLPILPEDLEAPNKDYENPNFNLLTVFNERIGAPENFKELPKPMDIVNNYIEVNHPEFLSPESVYMSTHDGYLLDPTSLAAINLLGLSTELNGYTHGVVMEKKTKSKLPDMVSFPSEDSETVYNIPNPYKGQIFQLDGLFYFLHTTNLYFNLLRDDHPELWENFFTEHNKIYLKKLFSSSIETAASTNFCENANRILNIGFYVNEFRNLNKEILEEIVGEELVKQLLCEGYDLLTEVIED